MYPKSSRLNQAPAAHDLSDRASTVLAMQLTDDDKAVLEFEGRWWKYPGAKEQEVRERFGISATTYYQRLNAIIDRDDALAHDPMLVRRLRRLRSARRHQRSSQRLASDA